MGAERRKERQMTDEEILEMVPSEAKGAVVKFIKTIPEYIINPIRESIIFAYLTGFISGIKFKEEKELK